MTALAGSAQGALRGPPGKPREKLPGDKERRHELVVTRSNQEYAIHFRGAVDGAMTRMPVSYRAYVQGWQPNLFARIENVGETDVVNPWITVDRRGDWRTIQGIVKEAIRGCKTDAEKARALWDWQRTHRFHATTWDKEVKDAVKMYNVYGYTLCGDDAVVLNDLWKAAGLKTRRGYPVGHCVTEIFYDGGFHMLDGDEHVICLLRDNKTIASEAQIVADHDLMKRTHTYGISHDEDEIRDQFSASLFPYEGKRSGDWGFGTRHKMHFTLRPGESVEWRWAHVGKEYTAGEEMTPSEKWSKNGRGTLRTAWGRTAHDNLRNGKWVYRPVLAGALYRKGIESERNVACAADGDGKPSLRPAKVGQVARITWKVACPYVMVGGAVRCQVRRKGKADVFRLRWSRDGKTWRDLGQADALGARMFSASLDKVLSPPGKPMYQYFLRVEMQSAEGGDVGLDSICFDTDVQMSLLGMPELTVGKNRVRYVDETDDPRKVRITQAWIERTRWKRPAPPRQPVFPRDGAGLRPPDKAGAKLPAVEGTRFTFRWPAAKPGSAGATIIDYHIQVCDRKDMRWPLSPNFDKLTSRTPSAGKCEWAIPFVGLLNPGTTYYWRVRAKDSNGVWSPWSPSFRFRCASPGVPIHLKVIKKKGVPAAIVWEDSPKGRKPVAYRVYGSNEQGFTASDTEYLVRMGRGFCKTMAQYKARTKDDPFYGDIKTPANFVAETKARRFDLTGPVFAFYRVSAVDAKDQTSGPSDLVALPRPFIYTPAPGRAKVGQVYRYRPAATLSIGHLTCRRGYNAAFWQRETLTWRLVSGPRWLRLQKGELIGTPGDGDAGSHDVVLKVVNSSKASAEQKFRLIVGK